MGALQDLLAPELNAFGQALQEGFFRDAGVCRRSGRDQWNFSRDHGGSIVLSGGFFARRSRCAGRSRFAVVRLGSAWFVALTRWR